MIFQKNRILFLFFSTFLLTRHSLAQPASYTAKDIISGCKSFFDNYKNNTTLSSALDEGICIGSVRASLKYQTGIARLISIYKTNTQDFAKKLLGISFTVGFPACPSKTSSVFDAMQYVITYGNEHPDQVNRDAEEFVGEAMAEAFPCTPESLAYYRNH